METNSHNSSRTNLCNTTVTLAETMNSTKIQGACLFGASKCSVLNKTRLLCWWKYCCHTETNETNNLARSHSFLGSILESITQTCMFMGCAVFNPRLRVVKVIIMKMNVNSPLFITGPSQSIGNKAENEDPPLPPLCSQSGGLGWKISKVCVTI